VQNAYMYLKLRNYLEGLRPSDRPIAQQGIHTRGYGASR
jgi:hypothetical protein